MFPSNSLGACTKTRIDSSWPARTSVCSPVASRSLSSAVSSAMAVSASERSGYQLVRESGFILTNFAELILYNIFVVISYVCRCRVLHKAGIRSPQLHLRNSGRNEQASKGNVMCTEARWARCVKRLRNIARLPGENYHDCVGAFSSVLDAAARQWVHAYAYVREVDRLSLEYWMRISDAPRWLNVKKESGRPSLTSRPHGRYCKPHTCSLHGARSFASDHWSSDWGRFRVLRMR